MEKQLLISTVKSAQKGEAEAQQTLYSAYAKTVYFFALKLMKHREDAEDMMQEVFITAFHKISELKEAGAFPTWLNRITANICTNELKKRQRLHNIDADIKELEESGLMSGVFEHFEEDNPLLVPDKFVDNAETSRIIMEVIDNLPIPQRMVVYYYYYQELTIAQIAESISASESTVKSRLFLARGKIRKELERLDDEEGIRLYSIAPIMLAPAIRKSFQAFEMPSGLVEGAWEPIKAKSSLTALKGASKTSILKNIANLSLKTKIIGSTVGVVIISSIITCAILFTGDSNPIPIVGAAEIPIETTTASITAITATSKATSTSISTTPATTTLPKTISPEATTTPEFTQAQQHQQGQLRQQTQPPTQNDRPPQQAQPPTQTAQPPQQAKPPQQTQPPQESEIRYRSVAVGEIIQFGGYDWRVLGVENGKALIITDYIISKRIYNTFLHNDLYHPITWENCELREYLNGEFYNDTFSAKEKAKIIETRLENKDNPWYGTSGGNDTTDKVFLLSIEEVVKYFGDSGQLDNRPTAEEERITDEYDLARKAIYPNDTLSSTAWWWLRSPGNLGGNEGETWLFGMVSFGGQIYISGTFIALDNGGVRPALWLDLRID